MKYLALLRGINVGGKNIILKEELRQLFEDLGFESVRTYIQSGNVLFRSSEKTSKKIVNSIEDKLSKRFSYDARAVVLSYDQYKNAVGSASGNWGKNEQQKHSALFLLGDNTPKNICKDLPLTKPEIETIELGEKVIFWSVSKAKLTKTSYTKLAALPVYKEVTI